MKKKTKTPKDPDWDFSKSQSGVFKVMPTIPSSGKVTIYRRNKKRWFGRMDVTDMKVIIEFEKWR